MRGDEFLVGLRKTVTVIEDVHIEGGREVPAPVRIAAVGAVIENPLVGQFVEDLSPLIDAYCEPLGRMLSEQALRAVGQSAEGYGKGALVGFDGEIEHGSAIIHNLKFGNFMRDAVDGTSLVPSAEKRGAPGAMLDIALKHKTDHRMRSHHQTFEVRIPDAPRPGEIVIWVAFARAGRPQQRLAEFGSEMPVASSGN